MAHIKVVRRGMRPEEWTKLRMVWLQRGILREKAEITSFEIRDARQTGEDTYEYYSEAYRPLNRGDLYFTPDGTAFIRGKAVIPESMRGKDIFFFLKTAAEMIVKVNGKYAGGIDPNRDRFLLNPFLDGDEVRFEIEAYNRSKPDDERNPESLAIRGCRQIFEGAYFATVNEDVQSLVYDFILLLDIAESELFNEDYRKFLWRELGHALDLIDFDTFEGVTEAAEYVEEHIYANTDYRGSGDVALVGHSHLDIAYYWRRIHAVQKNARTILIQMRLMDRYPEFHYTHTQPFTYELLKKYYPELYAELKEKIASGLFEPAGAMYVEPDCNIPSAESLIRQCLYGQLFYREEFGKTVDNAWLPDVFGNSWILPQILKKSGVDYFVSNKMSTWNDTNRFPHNNFIWKGLDGSCVYACVPPTHFITWNMPSQIQENWEAYQDKQTGGQTLNMYGYGDGGSGCTEEMLELARRFQKLSVMPKVTLTGAREFLHGNLKDNKNLAVWDGELYLEMHRGTFTTKAEIKSANRRLEFKLRDAELLSSLRYLKGEAYPAEELRACYKKLLINQFHDILPGSHIHPVYEDAMADYADIEKRIDAVIGNGNGSRWFNSLNFRRSFPSFIEEVEGCITRKGVRGNWYTPEMDGLSCGELSALPEVPGWLKFSPQDLTAETPYYRIRFREDGSMESLRDLELDREWVKPGAGFNRLHIYADRPGIYDAWDILPNYKDTEIPVTVKEGLQLRYADDRTAEFSCLLSADGKTSWRMVIRLFASHRAIEVENDVDWRVRHRLAKVNFGTELLTRELVCDTSAGFIKRDLTKNTTWQQARFEVCHHKWMDLSESGGGIAILNQDKYGVGLEGEEISLSLLRATMRPDITSDEGHHNICYAIVPHAGDAVSAGINEMAYAYNVPLVKADAKAPKIDTGGLILQAMKLSEDSSRIILRLSEQNGRRGRLHFDHRVQLMNLLEDVLEETDTVEYHPFELLTVSL